MVTFSNIANLMENGPSLRVWQLLSDGTVSEFAFDQVMADERLVDNRNGRSWVHFKDCYLAEKDAHHAYYLKLLAQAADLNNTWGFDAEASK